MNRREKPSRRIAILLAVILLLGAAMIALLRASSTSTPPIASSALADHGARDRKEPEHRGHEHGGHGPTVKLRASVISIRYRPERPPPDAGVSARRTRAEAETMAQQLADELKKAPARFAETARSRSEDEHAPSGGELATWEEPADSALAMALNALAVGEVSDPIDTEQAFLVFRREVPLEETTVRARRLVVAWKGASRAPVSVERDKAQALERARSLAARARQDPPAFSALIRAESDGWDADKDGLLGEWKTGGGRYSAVLDKAVLSVATEQIADPVETAFGYEILQRLDLAPSDPLFAGAHILLSFRGAPRPVKGVVRERAQAEAEAQRIAKELQADPGRFASLARQYSDDATAAKGGDLGSWRRGKLPGNVQVELEKLPFGGVSGPIETPFGFHVVQRRRAPTEQEFLLP